METYRPPCNIDSKRFRLARKPVHILGDEWKPARKKLSPNWPEIQPHRARVTHAREIERVISDSQSITALPLDWDGEGALQISESTWRKAAGLLREVDSYIYRSARVYLAAPHITPCADGSIDLYWTQPAFRLLVNVKEGAAEPDFYAVKENGQDVRGPLPINSPDLRFLSWLVE